MHTEEERGQIKFKLWIHNIYVIIYLFICVHVCSLCYVLVYLLDPYVCNFANKVKYLKKSIFLNNFKIKFQVYNNVAEVSKEEESFLVAI
jgi:hypothetical protein